MNNNALWLIGMGLFFGSIGVRAWPEFSNWVTTFGAVAMLIGIFVVVARKSKKHRN
jgi:LPXTG-motif cell wall-anchored protein